MGDGTGAVMLDGKMEDDASLKQCLVMVELAEQLAAIDPELKKQYDAIEVPREPRRRSTFRPRRSVLYMPSVQRAGAGEGQDDRRSTALILDLEDAVAPDAKPAAREAACAAAASGEYGRRELTIRVNGIDTEWHDDDLAAACRGRTGRGRRAQGRLAPTRCRSWSRRSSRPAPPTTPSSGRWSRRRSRCCDARGDRRRRPSG